MLWLPHTQLTPSIFNFSKRDILSQIPTFALTPTRPLPQMRLAPPLETPPGTLLPLPEPLSQLRPWMLLIQPILSTFNLDLRDTPFQMPTSALTLTKPPLLMRPAVPLVTLLGTLSLPLEPLSHPRPLMLLTQDIPSTSNWKLPQPPTPAPTLTRPLPPMRLAPLMETPPGTLLPPPELEPHQRPWIPHIQDTPSTERNTRSEWLKMEKKGFRDLSNPLLKLFKKQINNVLTLHKIN